MALSTRQKIFEQLMAIQEKRKNPKNITQEILDESNGSEDIFKISNKMGQQLLRKSKGGN